MLKIRPLHSDYTDSSKIKNEVGIAVYINNTIHEFHLTRMFSTFTAEMLASLDVINSYETPKNKYIIFTASLRSIQSN